MATPPRPTTGHPPRPTLFGLGQPAQAGAHYREALGAYVEHDDRWSLALLLEDVVLLALHIERAAQALQLVGAADALREQLAAPRAPAPAKALDSALAGARQAADAGRHLADGAALDQAGVVALVAEVCGT